MMKSLLASAILPFDQKPLVPGIITVCDNRITAVGSPDEIEPYEIIELPDTILLPGFVNAHCHLELTSLGPIPGKPDFVSWIRELVKKKLFLDPEETKRGIREGIKSLIKSGVTTVGDQISFNTPWEEITSSPLRGRIFGEVLGVLPEVCGDIYATFQEIKKHFCQIPSLFEMNISPHSVHALHPLILKKILENEPPPLSCHLAESLPEEDYFKRKGGEFMTFIQERGIDSPHQGESGLDVLARLNLDLSKLMVVHGNYLNSRDQILMKQNNLSLVYCPGSHVYFNHRRFPLEEYLSQGFNVALGTDSVASNIRLDFLEELRLVQKNHPSLSPSDILKMATRGGARALRMEDQIGSLTPGKKADIIGFKWDGKGNPEEAVLKAHEADFVMIDGNVVRNLDSDE